MRFELDASVRRGDGGRLLIGGTPPRMVRLSESGAAVLDRVLATDAASDGACGETDVKAADPIGGGLDPAGAALASRLVGAGLIHPLPDDGVDDPPVTTVIPVLDGGEPLAALIRALAAEGPVLVVDDGSRDGSAERAAAAGATVIANAGRPGPAGARNTGLRAAATDLVALLDADCIVTAGWRDGLAGLFAADPDLALVGPRVRSAPDGGAIAAYERAASPLDLGPAASLVGPGRRVSYLPAAALLARRDALLELGGFDESMRFGEDVDLVWRALAAGRSARYVAAREVLHRPRPTLRALVAQRAGYGSSAVPLRERHGDAVAPLRLGRHTAAVWLVATLRPRSAPLALTASLAIVARRGKDRPARLGLAELALRGQADAARHLSRALLREYLPLSLVAAFARPRARRLLVIAIAVDSAATIRSQPAAPIGDERGLDGLAASAALRLLDNASYSAGMWVAMAKRRDYRALLSSH